MRRILLLVAALLVIGACALGLSGAYWLTNRPAGLAALPAPTPTRAIANSLPPSLPAISASSTPEITNPTLDQLLRLQVPADDPIDLTRRLKGEQPAFATPASPIIYRVGDQARFWVARDITGTYELVTATLRYVTPHADLWVENGENVQDSRLKLSGDAFENKIYPTDRKYFGSEPIPGIDNDPHVFILNTHLNGAAGYFWSPDEYPPFVNRTSNQHEMFYMNVRNVQPGGDAYASVLAHEFTHMIHWNENRREGSWITEGLGDLAMQLNGWPQDTRSFTQNPDLQLTAWAGSGQAQIPHYAAAYLFLGYCLNRFGSGMIRAIVQSGTHDIASIQKALDQTSPGLRFDDVFADWVVANLADDRTVAPRYGYSDRSLQLRPQQEISSFSASGKGVVHQYGTSYINITAGGRDGTFVFDGSKQVRIIPTDPHSGRFMWWGNRADESDTMLTREFDLSGVRAATLSFWTWYNLESNFDYAYVEVSTDGGQSWHTLAGRSTTTQNPNGANYGSGLTCLSGLGCRGESAAAPQWIQEKMDLTPYAGGKILVRFESVTDAIYSAPGIALDDISIPEINFTDDVEHGDNGWQAQGFARIDNVLPQRFIVQAIELGRDGRLLRVEPVTLDSTNHGTLELSGLGRDLSRVVIAISGVTPITWETASYQYQLQ